MELSENTHVMSTQRTTALKKAIQVASREISTVRGRIFTEVFTRNKDKPLLVKRALAYRTLLENIPVRIFDNELVVGGITEKRKGSLSISGNQYSWDGAWWNVKPTGQEIYRNNH